MQPEANRRATLQRATEQAHKELDEIVASFDLTERQDYVSFLLATSAALIAMEQLLETTGVERFLPDWPERTRRAAITADLKEFGLEPRPLQLRRTRPSPSEMFGILYVLEGSRLGAQLSLAQDSRSTDPRIRQASHYLRAHDPQFWRSFVKVLEASQDAANQHEITSGAVYAFALFQRAFEQVDRVV